MGEHKILVFGDGRHLFRTICWVLEYKGYAVRLAPSPAAALGLLIEQNFDLIIARLNMEDLQNLDVLKRAQKLNPDVKIMVVSGDINAAFPLESFQIEVDDYLVLPISPSALMRRVGQCLEKPEAIKAAKVIPMKPGVQINQELSSRIMIMLHDIRGGLVSTVASLKLLKREKYGTISAKATVRIQELCNGIKNSTDRIDEFAQEIFPHHGQTAIDSRITTLRRDPPKPVRQELRPELRRSAETIEELR